MVLDHNHAHGPEFYSMYASERKPTSDLRQQTVAMLNNGANPTLVANRLNKCGLNTQPRDLYNVKQSLKFKGIVEVPVHYVSSLLFTFIKY